MDPSPPHPVTLPAVAVVDTDLVRRRRRWARPGQRVLAIAFGVTATALFVWRPAAIAGALVGVVLVLLLMAVVALSPWAAIRPPTSWYLGIESDGLRLPWALAPSGQVFLPWWTVGDVTVGRIAVVVPVSVVRVRLRPEARAALAGVDPQAVDAVLRRGFRIGLQGTSMTARHAVGIIRQVRR